MWPWYSRANGQDGGCCPTASSLLSLGPWQQKTTMAKPPKARSSTLCWGPESAGVLTLHCCFGYWTQFLTAAAGTSDFDCSDPLHPTLLSSFQLSLAGLGSTSPSLAGLGLSPSLPFPSTILQHHMHSVFPCFVFSTMSCSWVSEKKGGDGQQWRRTGPSELMPTAFPLGRGRQKWCTWWKWYNF